jgi:Fe-S cluster assembly iron-binding protein IscA
MLTVTEQAAAHLDQILSSKNSAQGLAIRFLFEKGKVKLVLDEKRPDDITFEHDHRTVLVMDPQVSRLLQQKTLDVQEKRFPRLALK